MLWSHWQCSARRNKTWHDSRLSRRLEILPCVAPHRDEGPTLGRAAESRSCLSQSRELPGHRDAHWSWEGRGGASLHEQQTLPAPGGTQTLLFLPEERYQGHLTQGEAITPKPVCSRVPEDTEQGHTLPLNALSQMQLKWPDSIFVF